MQAVKDSFYMTLRERLAQANPARTIGDDNRPGIVTRENDCQSGVQAHDAFYLTWKAGEKLPEDAFHSGWKALQCEISYSTDGTEEMRGEDRGRSLGELDSELQAILEPRRAALCDYTQQPATLLGGNVLWTRASLQEAEDDGAIIRRSGNVTVLWQEGVQA